MTLLGEAPALSRFLGALERRLWPLRTERAQLAVRGGVGTLAATVTVLWPDTVAAFTPEDELRRAADPRVGVILAPLHDQVVGGIRSVLWLLLGAVTLVLAVVVASVASLQLARAVGRTPEFAVRAAVGAAPGRVARQVAVENLLLGAAGTATGFLVAHLVLEVARGLAPADLPRISELRADGEVLLFAGAASLLAALATAALPAFLAARPRLLRSLGAAGRSQTGGPLLRRALGGLVAAQICLTFVLMVGAGLLLRSFVQLLSQPRGFHAEGVAVLTMHSWGYLDGGPARAGFVREVDRRLLAIPGVVAAGTASSVPLMEAIGAEFAPLTLDGEPLRADQNPPLVHYTVMSPGLLEALGVPLNRLW